MSVTFPIPRLARAVVRQLRLSRGARLLDVGCGNGELVALLRRRRMEAFGLFDGTPVEQTGEGEIPQLQPTMLHQSLPFLAQSFDTVVVRQSADYEIPLSTPEACTATANLLAALKPGGHFVYCGGGDFTDMKRHLGQFPGKGSLLKLGTGGIGWFLLRLSGLAKPGLPALKYTIPHEPISRLEWHRIAREAVANLSRAAANHADEPSDAVADSPAA